MTEPSIMEKGKKIYFIGIGGEGMSGIAEVLINMGFKVSGSDIAVTKTTERLESLGAKVWKGHRAGNVHGTDIVVVSSAIGASNSEVLEARERGIPVIPRSDMLGELMNVREGIAIAGAHGKTTTTSLAGEVMGRAGLDPTVVVGGKVKALGTNARLGEGKFIVAEVDESDGNFIRLAPVLAIITNIDREHLNFYGGLEEIYEAFLAFAARVPFHGAVICCADNPHLKAIMPRMERRVVTYGLDSKADIRGRIIEEKAFGTEFALYSRGRKMGELFLNIPGRYNVLNALGVCALAGELGIEVPCLREAFSKFQGVGRRFEMKGEAGGILFLDDYAHHPTEIGAVLETVRRNFDRRIVVLFQPHRYTRTRDLHGSFDRCFDMADEVFITGIYPAGERRIPGITGELVYRAALRGKAGNVSFIPDRDDLKEAVLSSAARGDLILTLGAGDIWKLGVEILEEKGS